MNPDSTQNQYAVPLVYSFVFTAKPFGIAFKNKDISGSFTNTNVYVSNVNKHCAAYGNIIVGSQLIKIQSQNVEGLNPLDIMRIVTTKYGTTLPLLMTFRKPVTRRLSLIKSHALKHDLNTECDARCIFLHISGFYKLWRRLASQILLDGVIICSADDIHIAHDTVFRNLLQWKKEQGLVLIVDDTEKGKRSTFWQRFSDKLVTLSDPSTYNTSSYSELQLDIDEYTKLDSFKYDVCVEDIENELVAATLNVNAVQEILYRSNVWLNIYDRDGVNINADKQVLCSSFEKEFDDILDEIASVWKENDDLSYVE